MVSGRSRQTSVDLYWIPLGAGAHSVRFTGIAFEAVSAYVQRRVRCDLYHSVLELRLPTGRFMIEMTPVPRGSGGARGVVAQGSVGLRAAGRFRPFRYEVRCWRDGIVPDIAHAVGGPVRITDDLRDGQWVYDLLPEVPTATWGRDEFRVGEMWTCNSVTSWVLTRAGIDVEAIAFPPRARAPGWDAGVAVARRPSGQVRSKVPRRSVGGLYQPAAAGATLYP